MSASNFGKFVLGALVGSAVGAVVGMLLAPRSGAETREMIREEFDSRTREAADNLREKSDVLKEKAAAFRDKMTDLSSDLEETGRRAVSKFTERKSSESGT
ncbi:MAG TPA: YtxH domain-containing protein [Coleofasciculaceae cyanobacterium]|jgi:gas vesicle protein